eukprot:CAMPEP_0194546332 /NCGR_PEP_ID=MMETSP0253-20130528/90505_1 /TAXON_ID=2966 /ORGANISM="Noctiluca scintillans" /LENGTH=81 /DNA_ID=CAMNT_0039393411 /DNA_START=447 /DNA_END=692 /DNA_ORIENTATION=-
MLRAFDGYRSAAQLALDDQSKPTRAKNSRLRDRDGGGIQDPSLLHTSIPDLLEAQNPRLIVLCSCKPLEDALGVACASRAN